MNSRNPVLLVAPARTEDAASIVHAVRQGFADELLQLTIYGCPGITSFVRDQIELQDQGGDTHYTVARSDGVFAGAAEIRRIPQAVFLNYIAIEPAFRSQGLGSILLRRALDLVGLDGRTGIVLDVLEDNSTARRWYDRLGFHAERRTEWWISALPTQGLQAASSIEGYPQAQASQREFGFSRFQLISNGARYEIGRLGQRWYRFTDPGILEVPGLTDKLRRLDGGRQMLLLAPDEWMPTHSDCRVAARTWRLAAPLSLLLENLDKSNSHRNCRFDISADEIGQDRCGRG